MTKRFNRAAIAGSLLFHVFLILWLGQVKNGPPRPPEEPRPLKRLVTHIVDPPTQLTQRAPNKAPLSKELVAEAILPHPEIRKPAPSRVPTPPAIALKPAPVLPPKPVVAKQVAKPQAAPEAPKIEAANNPKVQLPQAIAPPPPPIEKPKIVLENVQPQAAPVAKANVNPAFSTQNPVQDAVRNVARSGPSGSQAVGDPTSDFDNSGPGLNLPPSAGRPKSSLELKSDPMGVDFKPYLVRVLATVRRNWFAIYPEAARLGQRGRVLVEFAVAPDGTITKVVFSQQSGSRPLDEAAVAALSASNKLPPLPTDFKGPRVVLQFTFSYNMAAK